MKEPKRFVGIRNTATVDGAVPGLARNVWDQHKLVSARAELQCFILSACLLGSQWSCSLSICSFVSGLQ